MPRPHTCLHLMSGLTHQVHVECRGFCQLLEIETSSYESINRKHNRFSWLLTRWCYRITNNLETVISHHRAFYVDVVTLLQFCPNLKNLHLRGGIMCDEIEDGTFCLPKLFKLGLFLISRWTFPLSFAQPRVLLLFSIL